MSVACPCCKAVNESGPNCRRCKADLLMLFALENQRIMDIELAKDRALMAAMDGDYATAFDEYCRAVNT